MVDFETIWQQFHQELKQFIYSKVADRDVTNDILQEVSVKIMESIHSLKDENKLDKWIYQITRNAIVDYFRQQKKVINDEVEVVEAPNYMEVHQKLSCCIIPFINQLSAPDKEILLLIHEKKMSQKELAEYLEISYSGAKSRVQRAREKLKDLFEACCEIEYDKYGNVLDYYKKNTPVDCE
jgi:RNA polymerase sigma-70 factor (ECF subfamily)